MEADPLRSRITLVFDREGYSPCFFAEMKTRRIAILSYHKFPSEPGPRASSARTKVTLVHGEEVDMELAERGVCPRQALSGLPGRGPWVSGDGAPHFLLGTLAPLDSDTLSLLPR